jgi:DNA-binding XRE family transcriptional regulator
MHDHGSARVCEQCDATLVVTSQNAGNANRFCSRRCYWDWKTGRRKPLAERWAKRVARGDGCWEWTAYRDPFGYGRMGGTDPKSIILAHRASWLIHFGPIPDGLDVLHRCDNPPCSRPDHLFLGTARDNMQDASTKGRTTRGERGYSAKLTAGQVLAIRARYAEGGISQQRLADAYGVARETVSELIRHETWKHLP